MSKIKDLLCLPAVWLLLLLFVLMTGRTYGAWLYVVNGSDRAMYVNDSVGLFTPHVMPAQSHMWIFIDGPGPYGNTAIQWRWKDGQYGVYTYSEPAYSSGLTDTTVMALMVAPVSDATGAESYLYQTSDGFHVFTEFYTGSPPNPSGMPSDADATTTFWYGVSFGVTALLARYGLRWMKRGGSPDTVVNE